MNLIFIELFFYMTSNKNTCCKFYANTHSHMIIDWELYKALIL